MKLGELLGKYRKEHEMSMRDFAHIAGLTSGYISMLENGKNPNTGKAITPNTKTYKSIAAAMGMTLNDLLAIVDDEIDVGDIQSSASAWGLYEMPALRRVPRLGAIACGEPILAEQNIEGFDQVPDWVKCDFTLICKGDSMTGARIYDGDIVCIRQQETVESGQIAAVLIDGEATLKRVRYQAGGVVLWPENPDYEPMVYAGDDAARVRIIGLATHFISKVR